MQFSACPEHTVGIEWELQLVDAEGLDLYDGILPLLKLFSQTEFVKPEHIQSCVELNSHVAKDSDAAVTHIRQSLGKVLRRCRELEMRVCGAGTHPFCRRLALITPLERYQQFEECSGYLAHAQITFGTHVHVGMHSGDEAMRSMSHLIPALPAFIALSANSPFWREHKTGHAAYRHRILAASQLYGPPVAFRDWGEFDRFYLAAMKSGMIRRLKDIHWDIRPHPGYGTLEIRVMDAASDLETLHALTAFSRVLTVCMARAETGDVARVLPAWLPDWIEKENCYRASHNGLEADYIYNEYGDCRPLRGLIEDLVSFSEPVARDIGEYENLQMALKILRDKPGYAHQLSVFDETHSTRAVAGYLKNRLMCEEHTERAGESVPMGA